MVNHSWLLPSDGIVRHQFTYGSDGLRIQGQAAIPDGPGPYPVVLFSHGGFQGMGSSDVTRLDDLARLGVAAFASTFRGEGGSQGDIEYCLGEVDDVANLAVVASEWGDGVDAGRMSAVGFSHGACVTLFLPERLPGLRGVAVLGAPVEIDVHIAWHEGQGNEEFAQDWRELVAGLGPDKSPLYAELRPPVAMLAGTDDDVVPMLQSCLMMDRFTSEGWATGSYRVLADGSPGEVEPDSCQSAATGTDPWSDPGLGEGAVLVTYEGAQHNPTPRMWDAAFAQAAKWVGVE